VANGLGGVPRDLAAGVALQSLAREASPPSAEELPTLDPSRLSAAERARSQQLLAEFKTNPKVLAVLDAIAGPPSVSAVDRSNVSGNGTDGHAMVPPSATQH
jgi:hypothetical protein